MKIFKIYVKNILFISTEILSSTSRFLLCIWALELMSGQFGPWAAPSIYMPRGAPTRENFLRLCNRKIRCRTRFCLTTGGETVLAHRALGSKTWRHNFHKNFPGLMSTLTPCD